MAAAGRAEAGELKAVDLGYHSIVRVDVAPLVPPVDKLLDVGGGTGATARHLRDLGVARHIGVMDAVVDAHREGLDFTSSADLNDLAAVHDFLASEGPFGAILMLDVLEHLVDPWSAVDVFARHLSDDGVIVASIPNVRHHSASFNLFFRNRWHYTDAGVLDRTHLRFFVRETAIALLSRPGLKVEAVELSPISSRKFRLLNTLTFGLLRSFLSAQYLIRARRDG